MGGKEGEGRKAPVPIGDVKVDKKRIETEKWIPTRYYISDKHKKPYLISILVKMYNLQKIPYFGLQKLPKIYLDPKRPRIIDAEYEEYNSEIYEETEEPELEPVELLSSITT